MSIPIRYSCPHCNRRILHHPELAGQLVICSACKGEFYEPTDPLPGKPAERALKARPELPRRLRVPDGNNPKHDLAVLSRSDASDMRTISEIVEAVLLDDEPAPRQSPSANPISEETIHDFGYRKAGVAGNPAAPGDVSARQSTPRRAGPGQIPSTPLAGAAVPPLVPASVKPANLAKPSAVRPIPKPATPVPVGAKQASDRPLAGWTIEQMTDELRRRGLGVALVACEMSPMRNFELAFTENMTREDALAMLRKYLDTLREPKSTEKPGLLKRIFNKGEGE